MKTIIAGGRDYKFTQSDWRVLDSLKSSITEVVSGGAQGADKEGESWARSHGIPVKQFPAQWRKFGKSAGPIRNREMADYAEAMILFPGGVGTNDMFHAGTAKGLKLLARF